jgi:hypothetical protein
MKSFTLAWAPAFIWVAGFLGGHYSQGAFDWVWLSSVISAIVLSVAIQWAADE